MYWRICILRYDTTYLGSKYIYNSSFLIHYYSHKSQANESRTRHKFRWFTCTKRHSPLIISTDIIWKEEVLTLGTLNLVFEFKLVDVGSSTMGGVRGRIVIGVDEISAFTSDHIGVLRVSLSLSKTIAHVGDRDELLVSISHDLMGGTHRYSSSSSSIGVTKSVTKTLHLVGLELIVSSVMKSRQLTLLSSETTT